MLCAFLQHTDSAPDPTLRKFPWRRASFGSECLKALERSHIHLGSCEMRVWAAISSKVQLVPANPFGPRLVGKPPLLSRGCQDRMWLELRFQDVAESQPKLHKKMYAECAEWGRSERRLSLENPRGALFRAIQRRRARVLFVDNVGYCQHRAAQLRI